MTNKKLLMNVNNQRVENSESEVRAISGNVLWLDYRFGTFTDTAMTTPAAIGQTVKGWQDRSGNGYHATEATNPPLLAADGLVFDGVNDVLRCARMQEFEDGFSYFVVASLVDGVPTTTKSLFGSEVAAPARAYFVCFNLLSGALRSDVYENGASRTTTLNTFADGQSAAFIAGATANPTGNLQGYFNGNAVGTPAVLSTLTWANIAVARNETPVIGARDDNGVIGSFCACTIRALYIYNRPLSSAELTTIHRYIGHAHGISVP